MRLKQLLRLGVRQGAARAWRDRRQLLQVQEMLPHPVQEQVQEPPQAAALVQH